MTEQIDHVPDGGDELTRPAKRRRYGQSCEACRRCARNLVQKAIMTSGSSGASESAREGTIKATLFAPIAQVLASYGEASRLEEAYVKTEMLESFIMELVSCDAATRDSKLLHWVAEKAEQDMQPARIPKAAMAVKQKAARTAAAILSTNDEETAPASVVNGNHRTSADPANVHAIHTRMKALLDAAGEVADPVQPQAAPNANSLEPWIQAWQMSRGVSDLPPDHGEFMMQIYFCWINPRYQMIDELLFRESMRDNDGQFYSPFLQTCIHSSVARYIPETRHREDELIAKAFNLLGAELARPPALPTLQGLKCLVAACFFGGRHTQAMNLWPMITEMYESLEQNPPAYLLRQPGILRAIWWSIFCWDKTCVLTMQNAPRMSHQDSLARPLPDCDPVKDNLLWFPTRADPVAQTMTRFPPQLGYESTCFRFSCQSFQFLTEILEAVYIKPADRFERLQEAVLSIENRMETWQRSIPMQILLDPCSFHRLTAAPPHIIQFNASLRLNWIMLYRPLIQSPSKVVEHLSQEQASKQFPGIRKACQKNVDETHVLLSLFASLFPHSRPPHILIYSGTMCALYDLARLQEYQTNSNAETVNEIRALGSDYLAILWARLSRTLQFLSQQGRTIKVPDSVASVFTTTRSPTPRPEPTMALQPALQSNSSPPTDAPAPIRDLNAYNWPTASSNDVARLWHAYRNLKW